MAIIDLGSNTTRMLIIEVTKNGAYHLVEEDKGVVRLSEGEGAEGDIKPSALARAISAIKLFKGICDYHRVSRTIAVATAAVREARNQKEFLRAVYDETGIQFRVLSRDEEPYFGYLGVINTMPLTDGLIMDLGGGSMEVTAIEGRAIARSTSIPYGALNLTEGFLDKDKTPEPRIKELEAFLRQQFKNIGWLAQYEGSPLIGIGGTLRTIAKVNQRLSGYPFDELHNYAMLPGDITNVYNILKDSDLKERTDMPGLSRDRADIIVAGATAVNTFMRLIKVPEVRISSSGLRDGVFFHEYLKEPVVPDITAFGIANTSRLYGLDEAHARRVCSLATGLFSGLKPINGFTGEHERILKAAALLHELGYYYDYGKRFNNTFYNIIDNPIFGFTHLENYKAALVAAHYGAGGIKGRSMFLNVPLDKEELKYAKRLSVILGLADAFDRSRRGRVSSVGCRISKNKVELVPVFHKDISIEATSVEELSGYFKKAFDRELTIDI
jgi:exopolyphosphatase/guanosine-5'-triphosphate,3'-diphosphate pyrophosphatase